MPPATKLGRMETYRDGLLPITSHDSLIRGLVRSGDTLKPLCLHYHSTYGHQTWQCGDLP